MVSLGLPSFVLPEDAQDFSFPSSGNYEERRIPCVGRFVGVPPGPALPFPAVQPCFNLSQRISGTSGFWIRRIPVYALYEPVEFSTREKTGRSGRRPHGGAAGRGGPSGLEGRQV